LSRRSRRLGGLRSLGVPARGGSIYDLAFTHRSYAFEQPEPIPHNERLEFLGDAVLGVVVTELLFRSHPELPEGDLARLRASLVNTHALADLGRELDLGRHLRLGRGEEASGGADKDSLLANTFEAVVGAVYLHRGMRVIKRALKKMFGRRLRMLAESGELFDPKTALQEAAVKRTGVRPAYRLASSGPDHAKRFTAHVYLQDVLYGEGAGKSKKEAEQNAARQALERMEQDARAS
jgi:ribonuclease-3